MSRPHETNKDLILRREFETFKGLIDSFAKVKLVKKAEELAENMKDHFEVNLRMCSMILYGYCEVSNLVSNGILDKGFKLDMVALQYDARRAY